MKWILWTIVALVGLVGIVGLVGYLLPVKHEASRSADINRPPEDVYALISDLDGYRSWWPESEVKVAIVEQMPPTRFVTRIVEETAFGGTWTMEITPSGKGSRLTITERGEIYNPIFRALARFVFGYTSTLESCLKAAQVRLTP